MLKKIFWLFIFIILVLNTCAEKSNAADLYKTIVKRDKIIVGISFDSKPFGFKTPDGQIMGVEVDLAKEIAKRLLGNPNKVLFKNIASQDRINAAKSGDVDMVISTMTITKQRKKFVNFSVPYFVAGQAICVRKDSKIDSIYDLINKKVIVELGTTGERNIKRFVPNAFIQGFENNTDALNAFKSGFGDAITTDDALLQGLVAENANCVLLPKRLTKEYYGIAFKKSKQTNSLRYKINKIITEIKLDGTLQAIQNKWIIY